MLELGHDVSLNTVVQLAPELHLVLVERPPLPGLGEEVVDLWLGFFQHLRGGGGRGCMCDEHAHYQ